MPTVVTGWIGRTVSRASGLAAAAVVVGVWAGGAAAQTLEERVDAAVNAKRSLLSATVGVHVRDAGSGAELYSRSGEGALIPASNMKLLTTGAAIRVLGPDMSFETELGWDGDRVVIVGDGDPGLGDPALLDLSDPPTTVDDMLDTLAGALARGERDAASAIVIDDRVFDREYVHPTWPTDQLNRWYCAEVSGLNFHTNCLSFFFGADRDLGARPGGTPSVRLQPRIEGVGRWISVENKGEIVAKGRHTTWVARAAGARPANEFKVFGNVRMDGSSMVDVAVHEPGAFLGRLLAERLAEQGVTVATDERGLARVDYAAMSDRFDGFAPSAIVRTSMTDVLRRANTNSQNLYTEALIKRVGHEATKEPGSWSSGASVMRMMISEKVGPRHATKTRIADGSGMSRDNRVAPETLTAWLGSLFERPALADALLASMPQPGEGTLRRRFRGTETINDVYAKSGSINGVRCLSGLIITPDRSHVLTFSVMVNDISHGSQIRDALDLHEEVVAAIDGWLAEIAPAAEPEAVGG